MALTAYPDVEKALIQGVPDLLDLPTGITGVVAQDSARDASTLVTATTALMVVARVGGTDDGVTDYALVDIEIFAATRAIAYALVEQTRQILSATPLRLGDVIIDNTLTSVGPRRLPWDNEQLRRLGMTCRVSVRR